jgi:hypothetical protein
VSVEIAFQEQWEKLRTQMGEIQKELWKLRSTFKVYSIAVNDLGKDEWRLDKPLMVAVEQRSEEDFIACFYDADVSGYGDSIPEKTCVVMKNFLDNYEGFRV